MLLLCRNILVFFLSAFAVCIFVKLLGSLVVPLGHFYVALIVTLIDLLLDNAA